MKEPQRLVLLFAALLLWGLCVPVQAQDAAEARLANEYFLDGEYVRAIELYEKLLRKDKSNADYIARVVEGYLKLEDYPAAQDFVQKTLRSQKAAVVRALEGKVLAASGNGSAADASWKALADETRDPTAVRELGSFFLREREVQMAEYTYQAARKREKNPTAYANELSHVYRYLNDYAQVMTELVNVYRENPGLASYMRGQMKALINDQSKDGLERGLLMALQSTPADRELGITLYDLYVQTEQWQDALRQAKALDKQLDENGRRLFALASVMQQNEAYALSNDALQQLIDNPGNPYYVQALSQRAKNYELIAFSQKPLDTLALREAVSNYDRLINRYGRNAQMQEVMYRKARLCALYLRDPKTAMEELAAIENLPVAAVKKADARLLLGDVLLFQDEHVKARMQYQQVADAFKEDQVGAQARFRLARLDYYIGQFEDAKAYLKILKENTTNDISNDAIQLYLTIQDNIGMDTTTRALSRFAHAELLQYQGHTDEAMALLDSVMYAFPSHPLLDDILYAKAMNYLSLENTDQATTLLARIVKDFSDGVLADKALFALAEIYEYRLKDKDQAMKHYMKLLIDYPASILKVEARKRIRALRGERVG